MEASTLQEEFKIFLIDDQRIANFVNKKLIEISGVCKHIRDFINPLEALEELETGQPNLIFLDLNMPEIDGWTFLDRMSERNTEAKVVIVTSSTSELDRERATHYPQVIDYFTKPLNKELVTALRERFI